MQGHKISGTRQWNRHWQSTGGGVPPVPVYDDFGDFPVNIMYLSLHSVKLNGANIELNDHFLCGLYCFINEGLIYFYYDDYPYLEWYTSKFMIPANFELELKNKIKFNTNDLFNQYPNGFHNISMKKVTLTFFGRDIEFYEVEFDLNASYQQRYIEFNFAGASINKIDLDAYATNGNSKETCTYYGTWRFKGVPTRTSFSLKKSNIKFEDNLNNYYVGEIGHGLFGNFTNGIFIPPFHLFGFNSSYDINNLYTPNGSFNFPLNDIDFLVGNSFVVEATGSPAFNSIGVDATNFPIGYYDSQFNFHYYCQYEGTDVGLFNTYTRFNIDNDDDYTILNHIKMSTYY